MVSRRRLLVGSLAAGAGLAVAGGVALRLEEAASSASLLSETELAIVAALAETLFPGGPLPLDGIEAGVPAEVDRIVAEVLPPVQQKAFRYLLRTLEWGTAVSRGTRFTQLSLEDRTEVFEIWGDPTVLPRRIAAVSLKAVLAMAYFSHPDVLGAIGWRATCGGGTT